MNFIKQIKTLFVFFIFIASFSHAETGYPSQKALKHISKLASEKGIGARVAGSKEELAAANYILDQFQVMGIEAKLEPFKAVFRGHEQAQSSQNVIATLKHQPEKVFIIGGHYDSVPKSTGSAGVIDNAASISLMLVLAESLIKEETLPYSLKFIAFGAEEVGLNGAKHYVQSLSKEEKANIVGMLNLDSITGGDNLYIHSALATGYDCDGDKSNFAAPSLYRDKLLALSQQMGLEFMKHPGNPAYPPGETGGWSDHAPFACAGIPIANIEATNFSVLGQNGKDGYSQTENPNLWTCYDEKIKGSCDPAKEEKWGQIWHTEFDKLGVLDTQFPGRLDSQLEQSFTLLHRYFTKAGK